MFEKTWCWHSRARPWLETLYVSRYLFRTFFSFSVISTSCWRTGIEEKLNGVWRTFVASRRSDRIRESSVNGSVVAWDADGSVCLISRWSSFIDELFFDTSLGDLVESLSESLIVPTFLDELSTCWSLILAHRSSRPIDRLSFFVPFHLNVSGRVETPASSHLHSVWTRNPCFSRRAGRRLSGRLGRSTWEWREIGGRCL